MRGLSINAKLILGNLSYSIPILVLIQQMVSVYQGNIQFAEWERKGNIYQTELEQTFKLIGNHAWLAQRAQHGDSVAANDLNSVSAQIDGAIQGLEKVQSELGSDLQFTSEGLGKRQREHYQVSTFKKEWEDLKQNVKTIKPTESLERHTHLIADLRAMITHAGDTSNLILDPDLDSYYLMDITLLALPQIQDRLFSIITKGEQIVRSRVVNPEDMKWLLTTSAFLKQADLDRIVADVQTSLNEDANFYGKSESLQAHLGVSLNQFKSQVESLIGKLDTLASSPNISMSPKDFLENAEMAYQSSFSYWKVGAEELETLLKARIKDQVSQKNQSLFYGILALVLATCLATYFGLSVRRSIIDSIKAVTRRLSDAGHEVTKASQELSRVSQSMSAAAQEQASTMEETSASLYEIRQMITSNINSAESSTGLAGQVSVLANETSQWMEELKLAMRSIFESNERITALAKIIQEIGDKTEVIDEIVFKTQLLSFNASVEAERAGEHGRGFAVVAQEVGNLAQMSGKAATEIATIVKNSIREADSVTVENRSRVQRGENLAHETSMKMAGVIQKMTEILTSIDGIAKASREQGEGVNQITVTVENLNMITQQNAALAEECSSSSVELSAQGEGLVAIINEMIALVNSGRKKMAESRESAEEFANQRKVQNTKVIPMPVAKKPKVPNQNDLEWEKIG